MFNFQQYTQIFGIMFFNYVTIIKKICRGQNVVHEMETNYLIRFVDILITTCSSMKNFHLGSLILYVHINKR